MYDAGDVSSLFMKKFLCKIFINYNLRNNFVTKQETYLQTYPLKSVVAETILIFWTCSWGPRLRTKVTTYPTKRVVSWASAALGRDVQWKGYSGDSCHMDGIYSPVSLFIREAITGRPGVGGAGKGGRMPISPS